MVATTTVHGHVARALDFQARDDIYVTVGRQTPWDEAQLIGTNAGDFTISDTSLILEMDVDTISGDPLWLISVTFLTGLQTVAAIVNAINNEWQSVTGEITIIAYDELIGGSHYIKIKSAKTGDAARVTVVTGNTDLGFTDDQTQWAFDADPPPSDPSSVAVEEIEAFKKTDIKELVVPDEDGAAEIIGTGAGVWDGGLGTYVFDTTVDSTFGLTVDAVPNFTINLTSGATVTIAQVVQDINDVYHAQIGADPADIASVWLDKYVRIVSPTVGGTSYLKIDDLDGNPTLGLTAGEEQLGHVGGTIFFRDQQYRIVPAIDAFDEGARWVYLESSLNYDEYPLIDFRQIGWYSHLVPLAGHESEDPLLEENVDDPGILEIIDNRRVINRAIDEKERITIIIEF